MEREQSRRSSGAGRQEAPSPAPRTGVWAQWGVEQAPSGTPLSGVRFLTWRALYTEYRVVMSKWSLLPSLFKHWKSSFPWQRIWSNRCSLPLLTFVAYITKQWCPLKHLKILVYHKIVNRPLNAFSLRGTADCPSLKSSPLCYSSVCPPPSALVRFLSACCLDLKCWIQIPKAQCCRTLFP